MPMNDETKKIVGRAERLSFPELEVENVPARIDTGAKTSSIWVSKVTFKDGSLVAVLFGEDHELYTGKEIHFDKYDLTVVSTSTGEEQQRYKVRLLVKIKGKKVRAWFTLADRSTQVYPVLIGRNVLLGKFVVDVKKGHTLKDQEQARTESLKSKLDQANEEKS